MSEIQEINRHLEELRKRVLRIVIIVIAITAFLLTFHAEPIEFAGISFFYPIPEPLDNMAAQITDYLRINLVPENVQLIQTAPGQAFFAQVYIAALVGIVAAMPVIIKEAVGFLKPALKENEIHVGRSISFPALGLFISGCLFSYFLVIPYVLEFLVPIRRICRVSDIFECHGFCNICFTILVSIWNIISASIDNVCCNSIWTD